MTTYEQIAKANAAIQTTPIKGKDYAEVNQRIKAFRMVYPTGRIETFLQSNENGVCVFRAVAGYYDSEGFRVLGTGTAYEKEDSSYINKTSYIENCETSAVGRALGMAGFGIDTSVASYEEVATAIEQQKASEAQIRCIKDMCTEEQIDKLKEKYKLDKIEDITAEKAGKILQKLRERKNG